MLGKGIGGESLPSTSPQGTPPASDGDVIAERERGASRRLQEETKQHEKKIVTSPSPTTIVFSITVWS